MSVWLLVLWLGTQNAGGAIMITDIVTFHECQGLAEDIKGQQPVLKWSCHSYYRHPGVSYRKDPSCDGG